MKLSISTEAKDRVLSELGKANRTFDAMYPGDRPDRQPVHTVYGGAQLFKSTTISRIGEVARATLKAYAPDAATLASVFELSTEKDIHKQVYQKVLTKLENEPVEDFRIDFEDGFGNRPDAEEDETAVRAAHETAKGMAAGILSPFIGIRIKPFTEELKSRGVRTLDLFLTALLEKSGGKLPQNFVVILPKVTIPEQVEALVSFFESIEDANGLPKGSLKMEIMVETTQSIMNSEGKNALRALVQAGEGRCIAAHFGTYDYTASSNITARYQAMDHPVCDFAHHMMKVALGGTGVWLSDGATNVMPVGPHRGKDLSPTQVKENTEVVHRAWKLGYGHIRHSLWHGLYQGWDLHPAQLPMRYTAIYAFFLESYEEAALRLRNFVEMAAQASLSGDVFDDAATGQGLLNYFLKALNCGAISEAEAVATGLTMEEFRSRSFAAILQNRRNSA